MLVEIIETPLTPWERVSRHEREVMDRDHRGGYGAAAVFAGTMRDFNEGDSVEAMVLEHYPGMTDRYLQKISIEAAERWDILDTLIVHRVGPLYPNDPIVVVAAWSAHRGEAFHAARFLIEELKNRAPFWKKEQLPQGERWVAHNTKAD